VKIVASMGAPVGDRFCAEQRVGRDSALSGSSITAADLIPVPRYGRFSGLVQVGERAFWGINPRPDQNRDRDRRMSSRRAAKRSSKPLAPQPPNCQAPGRTHPGFASAEPGIQQRLTCTSRHLTSHQNERQMSAQISPMQRTGIIRAEKS
jgi:hypothetical protein